MFKDKASQDMIYFEADLQKRINFESTRSFDQKRLLDSQRILQKIAEKIHRELDKQKASIRKSLPVSIPQTDQASSSCFRENLSNVSRINIVGSNGKGSTAFYLAHQALLGGLGNVGLYTSPHLHSVLERIRLGIPHSGQAFVCPETISIKGSKQNHEMESLVPITAKQAWQSLKELEQVIPEYYESLSYFEILTVLCYYYFHKQDCFLQIYEAGLGGRFDATRMVQPQAVVLTVIEREHTQILGSNILEILKEKLAILSRKHSRCLFCMPQPHIAKKEIEGIAKKLVPDLYIFFFEEQKARRNKSVEKPSQPNYLVKNKSFATFILKNLGYPSKNSPHLSIPGRLEQQQIQLGGGKQVELIFDTAHNPPAMACTLRDILTMENSILKVPTCKDRLVVLALLPEREVEPCLRVIRQAGFKQVWQLLGKSWAGLEASAAIRGIEEAHLLSVLKKSIKYENLRQIVFLGTHRSYDLFRYISHSLHH